MRTLTLAALLLAPTLALADAKPDDNHVIDNDRVGPFHLGMTKKDALDVALKAFSKSDVKLGDKGLVELPHLKLTFAGAGDKATLAAIEVAVPTFGKSDYLTADGVGPGASEKDVRLAYRDAVKRRKVGGSDGLTPDALPAVHFVCSKGGLFTAEKCATVTVRKGSH
jgi:hypothetical protein